MNRVIVQPAAEPITLDEAKIHCEIEVTSTYHDEYLQRLIKGARLDAENYLGRSLITQTREEHLAAWPDSGVVHLPGSPVLEDEFKIEYYNSENVKTLWSSANYELDTISEPARVRPIASVSFPTVFDRFWPIVITYKAGYGAAGDDVPENINAAILFRIGTSFLLREEIVIGSIVSEYKGAFESKLHPDRIYPMRPE